MKICVCKQATEAKMPTIWLLAFEYFKQTIELLDTGVCETIVFTEIVPVTIPGVYKLCLGNISCQVICLHME